MLKSIKIVFSLQKIAKVKWSFLLLEFITLLIPSIFSIISPILTANVISDLTVYNYNKAIYDLSLDFGLILISAISYLFYHLVCSKNNRTLVFNLQNYVYENIGLNPNIKKLSVNTMSGIWTCASFEKDLLYKICFLIKSIIILIIIAYYNILISICLIVVSLISVLFLRLTNTKIQKYDSTLTLTKLESLEFFNSVHLGSDTNSNLNIEQNLKDKYFKYVDYSVKINNKINGLYGINKNFISLLLKTAVFALTIYLIFLVKSITLTLTLYLILTPYLSSSASNLISFFEIFSEVGTVENILKEFNALKFKQSEEAPEKLNISSFNLSFFNVSAKINNKTKIENINFTLKHSNTCMFVGEEGCGKRVIFNLLERRIKPTSGSIFIDNKNIFDFDNESYNKIVSCTTKKPYFYNISIYENLFLACQNKHKITKTLKLFGLYEKIERLPEKINTVINESINKKLLFFLGIVRTYLINPKIICIYELPENFNATDQKLLSKILKILKQSATIIIFSHTDTINFPFLKTFYIEGGKIKNK